MKSSLFVFNVVKCEQYMGLRTFATWRLVALTRAREPADSYRIFYAFADNHLRRCNHHRVIDL